MLAAEAFGNIPHVNKKDDQTLDLYPEVPPDSIYVHAQELSTTTTACILVLEFKKDGRQHPSMHSFNSQRITSSSIILFRSLCNTLLMLNIIN